MVLEEQKSVIIYVNLTLGIETHLEPSPLDPDEHAFIDHSQLDRHTHVSFKAEKRITIATVLRLKKIVVK